MPLKRRTGGGEINLPCSVAGVHYILSLYREKTLHIDVAAFGKKCYTYYGMIFTVNTLE